MRERVLQGWDVEPGVPMAYDPTRQQLLLTLRRSVQGSEGARAVLVDGQTLQLQPVDKPVRLALWLPAG